MSAHATHRREQLSTDTAPGLTVMTLHMLAKRGPIAVDCTTYWALFAPALTCGHERDGDSELQYLRCWNVRTRQIIKSSGSAKLGWVREIALSHLLPCSLVVSDLSKRTHHS